MKKTNNRPTKKTALILCLALLLLAGGLLLREQRTTSTQEQEQTVAVNTHTAEQAVPSPSPDLDTELDENKAQPAAFPPKQVVSTPQKENDKQPSVVSEEDGIINIIQSIDPDPSDWKGSDDAGVRSRKVTLHQNMINGQPLKEGTELSFDLFDDVKVTAVVSTSLQNVNGTVSTTAKIKDSRWGRAFIASSDGQLHARIRVPEKGKIYALDFNQQTGRHYTLELDPVLAEPDEGDDQRFLPAAQSDIENIQSAGPVMLADEAVDASSVVDIMVVYTDDALTAAGSQAAMDNKIAIGVSMANDAHTNTGSFISWNLVHSYEIPYVESGDNGVDLDRLTFSSTYDPFKYESSHGSYMLDDVHVQRDNYGADYVIMINATGSGGMGWILNDPAGNARIFAFSVIDDNSFASYTPVHEVGHNMGLHHAKDQSTQPGPTLWEIDAYGFGESTAGWHWHPTPNTSGYASIMTYTSGTYFPDGLSHVRVGIFSDPNITDHGMPAGNVFNGNSAKVLRQLRKVYAAYSNRLSSITVQVDYPNGGEMLIAGKTYSLRWDSSGVIGDVKIELLLNGNVHQVIDASTLNDRTYAWTVPANLRGTGYTVRISNFTGTITDSSDAVFKIATVLYTETLDSNPSFTATGAWEYGVPTVDNTTYGGPIEAYTGTNIYDTNLDGNIFTDSNLTTGAIDCSNYSETKLKFMGQFSVVDGDYAKVQVSNNGINWTDLYSATNLWATSWSASEYDISAVADGRNTVYIRWIFDYTGGSSRSGMSVDDILVYGIDPLAAYPVTYNANSATGGTTPLSQQKTEGFDLTLATNSGNLIRTGYAFVGWNTAANGSGTNYVAGGTYSLDAALTLYVKWTPRPTYPVNYNANSATGGTAPLSQQKTQGVDLILATNSGNLRKNGYVFAGWNTAADGSGTNYSAGGTYSFDTAITLYANWKRMSMPPILMLLLNK